MFEVNAGRPSADVVDTDHDGVPHQTQSVWEAILIDHLGLWMDEQHGSGSEPDNRRAARKRR
jgi:hypothetical protein